MNYRSTISLSVVALVVYLCTVVPPFGFDLPGMTIGWSPASKGASAKLSPSAVVAVVGACGLLAASLSYSSCTVGVEMKASIWRKLLALLIDWIVNVTTIAGVLAAFALLVNAFSTGDFAWSFERDFRRIDLVLYVAGAVGFGVLVWLFSMPAWLGKQSVGQTVAGIRVVVRAPVSLQVAVVRTLLGGLALAAPWLSLPLAMTRKDKRMWHDAWAKTDVVMCC